MGTRGAIGYRINNIDKVTYNHYDSYPSELGINMLNYIREYSIDEMKETASKIKLIPDDYKPEQDLIDKAKELKLFDDRVSSGKETDIYSLLRNAQGDLSAYHKIDVMIDSKDFLYDSLFCEWAYIINLDDLTLEVYKGFNKNPKAKGRYASETRDEEKRYYGVRLVKTYKLKTIRLIDDSMLNLDKRGE